MKVFFGGQTVTFGKDISDIGNVWTVVLMGLSSQDWKDWWIKIPAKVKQVTSIVIHPSFANDLLEAMYDKPWIVEASQNSVKTPIIFDFLLLVPFTEIV